MALRSVQVTNFGTLVFIVKKTTGTGDEGYVVVNTSTLAVDPFIKSPGYDIKQEDPSVYDGSSRS